MKLSLQSAHRVVAFVDVVDSVGLYRRVGDEAAQSRIEEALAFAQEMKWESKIDELRSPKKKSA